MADARERELSNIVVRARQVAEACANIAHESDAENCFPAREFALLREAGLLSAPLAHTNGGLGLGNERGTMRTLLSVLKETGRGNLAVGRVYEGHANALQLINLFGDTSQIKRFAGDVHDGKLFGVWNTQAHDGITLHRQAGGKIEMRGCKIFTSGAQHLARPVVTGAWHGREGAAQGWQMCVVPMEKVGADRIDASWWQPLGMRASVSYKIDFTGIELTDEDLIGAVEDYYRQPFFSGGAIRFAAVQLGGAQALFDCTRDYLRSLQRTGDDFQTMRAGEIAIKIEGGELWLDGAAQAAEHSAMLRREGDFDNPQSTAAMLAYANMTRTAIEEICLDVMRLSERSIGARGLLRPHPMERIHRDLTLYLRQPATDAALLGAGRFALDSDTAARELWHTAGGHG